MAFTPVPTITSNELIRTTWGNAVINDVNIELIRRDGAVAMTGQLVLPATNPTLANQATRKAYVDATFVTVAGDTMTGNLFIDDAQLRIRAAAALADFYNLAGTSRYGFVRGDTGGLTVFSDVALDLQATGAVMFGPTGGATAGLMTSSVFLWAKAASSLTNAGVEMSGPASANEGAIFSTTDVAGNRNLYCRHVGTADADNQLFIQFLNAAGTQIGSIDQNGASGIALNDTSDYRIKTVVGPIGDAVDRVKALKPYRVTYNGDTVRGEVDAFVAHEVDEVVPDAVSGAKDAVYPEGHPNAGEPDLQGLDNRKLVPLLTAALQQALSTIDDLTARVAALEGAAP